jgi:hypothetical protein
MWTIEVHAQHGTGTRANYTYHARRVATVPQAIATARHEWQTISKRKNVRARITFTSSTGSTLQTLYLERI